MKVRVAKSAGFCWGVRRAVDRVIQLSDSTGQPVFTLGPLIHNPQTVGHLSSKNVHTVESPEEAVGGTLVYRAHGITPQLRKQVQAMGRPVSDATCPDVGIIASAVKKHYRRGYFLVIFGKKGHAETVGLQGYAPDRSVVVRTVEEVAALPDAERVCLVSQSTMHDEEFDEIAAAVRERYRNAEAVEIKNTICEDSRSRQQEVLTLAREMDAMVIVGGRNSSNTNHLAKLSRQTGTRTFHIETEEELDPSDFSGCRSVGVTAGASTPNWMIERVRDRLAAMEGAPDTGLLPWLRRAGALAIRTNLYLAAGALGLGALCLAVLGYPFRLDLIAITALVVFAAHTHNQQNHGRVLAVNDPARYALFRGRPAFFHALVAAAALAALVLAAGLGAVPFLLVLVLIVGAAFYRRPVFQSRRAEGGRRSLSQMPASKDLLTAGAWATLVAVLPAAAVGGISHGLSPATWIVFAFAFCLLAVRSILFDMRDIQGDRMVGKETLPIVLGRERTRSLLVAGVAAAGLLVAGAAALAILPPLGLLMLLPLAWASLYLYVYKRGAAGKGLRFEVAVDGTLYVAGLAALGSWLAV